MADPLGGCTPIFFQGAAGDLLREPLGEYHANGGFLRQAMTGAVYTVNNRYGRFISPDDETGIAAVVSIKEETGFHELPRESVAPELLQDAVSYFLLRKSTLA